MRVRKGLLALQDLQKHLSEADMVDVLIHASKSDQVLDEIGKGLRLCIKMLQVADKAYSIQRLTKSTVAGLFSRSPNRDSETPRINKITAPNL